jgi:acetoin utilization protein AcuC
VWAILYLVVNDLPVPDEIPEVWSKRWASYLGGKSVATLHDPNPAYPSQPHKDEIARRNQLVATCLLDALMPFWF